MRIITKAAPTTDLLDIDYYPQGQIQDISVTTHKFSSKVTVHLLRGYQEEDMHNSKVVFPSAADMLLAFSGFSETKKGGVFDIPVRGDN